MKIKQRCWPMFDQLREPDLETRQRRRIVGKHLAPCLGQTVLAKMPGAGTWRLVDLAKMLYQCLWRKKAATSVCACKSRRRALRSLIRRLGSLQTTPTGFLSYSPGSGQRSTCCARASSPAHASSASRSGSRSAAARKEQSPRLCLF